MKSYLCIEDKKEVVKSDIKAESRPAIYFVLKAKNWTGAKAEAEKLGAKLVRVLTKKEAASEKKDGSYDVKL